MAIPPGSSKIGIGGSSLRSASLRQGQLATGRGDVPGATSAIQLLQFPSPTRELGESTYPSHRRQVVRCAGQQVEEPSRFPREESKAHSKERGRDTETRSGQEAQSKAAGERRRKERGKRGRHVEPSSLFSDHFLADEDFALDEDCRPKEAFPEQGTAAPMHVPGAKAETCNIVQLWNSLARWILSTFSSFARFLKSLLSTAPSVEDGTTSTCWPMPVPYPEVWRHEDEAAPLSPAVRSLRKAVNLVVLALDWLHMGRPGVIPSVLALGRSLSKQQWRVVKRFESQMLDVAHSGDIDAAAMGRTAAKVEGLDSILTELQGQAMTWRAAGYEQRLEAQSRPQRAANLSAGHQLCDPGVVIGKLKFGAPVLAKEVDASRISVPERPPEFDPSDLFSEPHKTVYSDPISKAIEPHESYHVPPRVRVHASRDQALRFLQFLDDRHRLELVPAEKVREAHLCGAFALTKDLEKDRLIVDARPANMLETTLGAWTRTMGSIQSLLQHEIPPSMSMYFSGTDLRDYYYCFRVSSRRAWRNALRLPLSPVDVAGLRCFTDNMQQHRTLYPCLKTMAMGDNNAVEMGQCAHVNIGLQIGAIRPHEMLSTFGKAPRGNLSCGLIIDDIFFSEFLTQAPSKSQPSRAAERLRAMCAEYERRNLAAHPKKTFEDETKIEFWGAAIDGQTGYVRPSPKRLVPLLTLTAKVAKLGFATVALLEILAGSWISVLQYRRRTLCLVDALYVAQRGREADDVVQLSGDVIDELWLLVAVGPIVLTDMRAQSLPKLFLSDASEEAQAVVQSEVPAAFTREVQRHCLSKGVWSKLLSPWKTWLRSHDNLALEDELPGGVPLVSHPLWLEISKALQFSLTLLRRVRSRKHINFLELETVLLFERELARWHEDVRYALASDSQVALACLVKGRSSSPQLNRALQRSLPTILGNGIYSNLGYVPSLANVADDPTRDQPIRLPSGPMPEWLDRALAGDFAPMDEWLEKLGYSPLRVAELPFADESQVDAQHIASELISELIGVQKADRLDRFDKAHVQKKAADVVSSFSSSSVTSPLCTEQFPSAKTAACSDVPNVAHVADPNVSHMLEEDSKVDENGEEEPDGQTKKEKHKRPKKKAARKAKAHHNDTRCCLKQGTPSAKVGVSNQPCLQRHPTGAIRKPAMDVLPNVPALPADAAAALAKFSHGQFFAPGGRRAQPGFVPTGQGVLDLYSGDAGVARWLSKRYGVWVLTFDYEHGPGQDLLDESVQQSILDSLRAGAFLAVGAAPDCSSFSRAVTPAVRDADYPFGKPNLTANMALKVARGNRHAAFVLEVLLFCEAEKIPYWAENPDGSFLWLLPPWLRSGIGSCARSYRFDMCRYHTAWRKRTRVATNTGLAGLRELCVGNHSHLVLRGKSKQHSVCWTKLAQVYPRVLCQRLGSALASAAGLQPLRRRLSLGGCAKCSSSRIGEASHPGPARPKDQGPRDPQALADVRLVEPQTAARQDKLWAELEAWLRSHLSAQTLDELFLCPSLAVAVLKTYAMHLFASGRRLYELRYTLIAVQNRFPHLKTLLSPAWAVVSKWEMIQPLQHRLPLPELLFKALFVLATLKGWYRWIGTLLLGYEGIGRIGEVLQARRCDLLLPSDLLEADSGVAFLKVRQPKTRFRGRGRVQHLKITNPAVVPFLERVFGSLDPSLALFPLSANVFRKRWDSLLDLLQIPLKHRPTPASVRGGGAVLAYRRGEHITDILWRMRLVSLPTLSCYLQELAADSLVSHLPPRVRHRVQRVATLFPLLLQSLGSATGVQARTYGDGLL